MALRTSVVFSVVPWTFFVGFGATFGLVVSVLRCRCFVTTARWRWPCRVPIVPITSRCPIAPMGTHTVSPSLWRWPLSPPWGHPWDTSIAIETPAPHFPCPVGLHAELAVSRCHHPEGHPCDISTTSEVPLVCLPPPQWVVPFGDGRVPSPRCHLRGHCGGIHIPPPSSRGPPHAMSSLWRRPQPGLVTLRWSRCHLSPSHPYPTPLDVSLPHPIDGGGPLQLTLLFSVLHLHPPFTGGPNGGVPNPLAVSPTPSRPSLSMEVSPTHWRTHLGASPTHWRRPSPIHWRSHWQCPHLTGHVHLCPQPIGGVPHSLVVSISIPDPTGGPNGGVPNPFEAFPINGGVPNPLEDPLEVSPPLHHRRCPPSHSPTDTPNTTLR